jgi:hypothetical protein
MQARLEIRRFPTRLAATVLAVSAAIAGSGALGYALRTPTVLNGPTRVIELPAGNQPFGHDDCIRIAGHKSC